MVRRSTRDLVAIRHCVPSFRTSSLEKAVPRPNNHASGFTYLRCRRYPQFGLRYLSSKSAQPVEKQDQVPADKASLRQLYEFLRPERTRLQFAFLALLGSSSVTLSYPVMLGKMVDAFRASPTTPSEAGSNAVGDGLSAIVSTSSNTEALFPLVLEHASVLSGVILLGGAATVARIYLIETSIERIQFRLRQRFFGTLLTKPMRFFDEPHNSSGALVARLNNDITVTSRILLDFSMGVRSTFSAIVGSYMVFTLAPWEMLGSFGLPVVALFGGGFAYGRLVRKIAAERQSRLALATEHAEERLRGLRTVRLFNQEHKELKTFEGRLDDVYAIGRKNALVSAGYAAIFVSGGGLFLLSVFYNCGILIQTEVVSIGTAVSLAMYCAMTGGAFTGLASAYGEVQKCLGACGKVVEVLENKDKSDSGTGVPFTTVFGQGTKSHSQLISDNFSPLSVRFDDVSFAYPQRPDTPVLDGFSLDIPAGTRLAVLGRSGSGKSTIVQLLSGLYAPQHGRVTADDVDLFAADNAASNGVWMRNQLGVVSQDPLLFSMSLRENVAYGIRSDSADSDTILRAAEHAYVTEFSDALPQQLDTSAGDRGSMLSGGQRQRVCLARALARRPRMLVFDEATSALDLRSESLVHSALKSVLEKDQATCLVITHRLSALQFVDHVAVMDAGKVVQYGRKDQVLGAPGEVLQAILNNVSGE